jgi:hypothetical protein
MGAAVAPIDHFFLLINRLIKSFGNGTIFGSNSGMSHPAGQVIWKED